MNNFLNYFFLQIRKSTFSCNLIFKIVKFLINFGFDDLNKIKKENFFFQTYEVRLRQFNGWSVGRKEDRKEMRNIFSISVWQRI